MFWLLIPCACCGRKGNVLPRYRQNTAYVDDELNWAPHLCPECRDENDQYWVDMWDDYYAGCL